MKTQLIDLQVSFSFVVDSESCDWLDIANQNV